MVDAGVVAAAAAAAAAAVVDAGVVVVVVGVVAAAAAAAATAAAAAVVVVVVVDGLGIVWCMVSMCGIGKKPWWDACLESTSITAKKDDCEYATFLSLKRSRTQAQECARALHICPQ